MQNYGAYQPFGSIGDLHPKRASKRITCVDCGTNIKPHGRKTHCSPCSAEHSIVKHRERQRTYAQRKKESVE